MAVATSAAQRAWELFTQKCVQQLHPARGSRGPIPVSSGDAWEPHQRRFSGCGQGSLLDISCPGGHLVVADGLPRCQQGPKRKRQRS